MIERNFYFFRECTNNLQNAYSVPDFKENYVNEYQNLLLNENNLFYEEINDFAKVVKTEQIKITYELNNKQSTIFVCIECFKCFKEELIRIATQIYENVHNFLKKLPEKREDIVNNLTFNFKKCEKCEKNKH